MDSASANADFVVLNWWRKHVQHKRYSSQAMGSAAQTSRIDVLEWWFQSGLEFDYAHVLAGAAKGGHVHVLDWFDKQPRRTSWELGVSGYDFKLEEHTHMLVNAIKGRHDGVLIWSAIKKKRYLSESAVEPHDEFQYGIDDVSLTTIAVEHGNFVALLWLDAEERVHVRGEHVLLACKTGNVPILEFVVKKFAGKQSIPDFILENQSHHYHFASPRIAFRTCYQVATKHGHVAVLDWLLQNKCPIDESANYLEVASRVGSVELLEWWSKYYPGYVRLCVQEAMVEASKRSHHRVLDWWKQEGFAQAGRIDASSILHNSSRSSLEWWYGVLGRRAFQASGPLRYTEVAGDFDQVECLDWWTGHGLAFQCTQQLVDDCTHKGKLSLLEWLHRWTSGSIKCSSFKFCGLDLRQQTLVVHWWASRGHPLCGLDLELDIQGTVPFVLLAALGHKGLLATLPTIDLDLLSANGDLQGLKFAVTSGANLVYTDKALSIASEKQLLAVLDWWLHSSVPIKLPNMESATWMRWNGPESVKKWWTDHLAKLQARVG